jgi:glycosyl transferase, family 25
MRSYCINLDRRPDKWEYVSKHLAERGIEPDRFPAIDRKPGWVGCRESFLKLLTDQYFSEDPFCVYEDDVIFLEHIDVVCKAMAELPKDNWDCLYLGASPREPQERYSNNLFRLKNAVCLHAVIWNPRSEGALEYIVSHQKDIEKIDDYMATVIQPMFNCFCTFPLVVTQTQFQSDTCGRSDVSTIVENYNKYCV